MSRTFWARAFDLSEVIHIIAPMFPLHWEYIGTPIKEHMPYNLHVDYLKGLNDMKVLSTCLVMEDRDCVGYCIDQVIPYIYSKNNKVAYNLGVYIDDKYRDTRAIKTLMVCVETKIKNMGAIGHFISWPGQTKRRLGYDPINQLYYKRLS